MKNPKNVKRSISILFTLPLAEGGEGPPFRFHPLVCKANSDGSYLGFLATFFLVAFLLLGFISMQPQPHEFFLAAIFITSFPWRFCSLSS